MVDSVKVISEVVCSWTRTIELRRTPRGRTATQATRNDAAMTDPAQTTRNRRTCSTENRADSGIGGSGSSWVTSRATTTPQSRVSGDQLPQSSTHSTVSPATSGTSYRQASASRRAFV
jgi:hypothetical protein